MRQAILHPTGSLRRQESPGERAGMPGQVGRTVRLRGWLPASAADPGRCHGAKNPHNGDTV